MLFNWRGLGRAYLFFWFFSGVTQTLLLASGATGYFPFRQGLIFSFLWLIPLLLWPQRTRVIAGVVGVVLWLFSVINLGYFIVYGQEFSQSVLFIIFESNPAEASEYLGQYFIWWMIPALLAYSATAWWLWRRVRPLQMPGLPTRIMVLVLLAILLVPPGAKVLRKYDASAEHLANAYMQRMEPALPWKFVFGYVQYSEQLAEMQSLLEQSRDIPPIAQLQDRYAGEARTIVLVIGESTNRGHMSLYGYPRQTTPELDALRGKLPGQLAVFNQVYAPRPYTIEALQQVLTFADQENPDLYLTQPSLMNIMKQAGYKTYWITNQQTLTKRNTMLTSFSQQMDEQIYLNHSVSQNSYQFDGNVLEPFAKILADGAERRFIVVHLLGTHMGYKYRYPDEFAVFSGRTGLPDWANDDQAELINEYDNAVRYNDHVMARLIATLADSGSSARLVYFSDHGEDVYDWPDHKFIGRNEAAPTPPMYAVPFLIWTSPRWQAKEPAQTFAGQFDRVYQTSHFIHTWADLAGLRFAGYEPEKSLVSPSFKERPILVGNPRGSQGVMDLRTLIKR